jgi:hypothetical protein
MTNPVADWGPLVVETDVDSAIIGTLRKWLPAYLGRVEVERGLAAHLLARPRNESYQAVLEDTTFPDAALPAVLVTTAQFTNLTRTGEGMYSAIANATVTVVVKGRTAAEARDVAALLGGSCRRILGKVPDLGGFANGLQVGDSNVRPVADQSDAGDRRLAMSMSQIAVAVDDIMCDLGGPLYSDPIYPDPDPVGSPDQPYDPLTSVGDVTIAVTNPGS